jgi:glutamine synthetase
MGYKQSNTRGETMNTPPGMLTLDQLRSMVEAGEIDTVLVAITDMQGRLQGKRCTAGSYSTRSPGTAPRAATT